MDDYRDFTVLSAPFWSVYGSSSQQREAFENAFPLVVGVKLTLGSTKCAQDFKQIRVFDVGREMKLFLFLCYASY